MISLLINLFMQTRLPSAFICIYLSGFTIWGKDSLISLSSCYYEGWTMVINILIPWLWCFYSSLNLFLLYPLPWNLLSIVLLKHIVTEWVYNHKENKRIKSTKCFNLFVNLSVTFIFTCVAFLPLVFSLGLFSTFGSSWLTGHYSKHLGLEKSIF